MTDPSTTPQRKRAAREGRGGAKGRFVVSLNDTDYRALRVASVQRDVPMAQIVRDALHAYLAKR